PSSRAPLHLHPFPTRRSSDLRIFSDTRQTDLSLQTPLRVGRWTWSNSVSVSDRISNARQEFLVPDSTVPGGVRHVLYGQTFATAIDWQTGINLPPLFTGTWKLQPGVSVVNTTSAGPFMIRNQFSDGRFVRQGKRLQFAASMSPTFFGFFPGIGPLERIRHSLSPLISYRYAPGAQVSAEFARVLDPTGQTLNARTDPQQTISVGLSQNIEAKLRRSARDTSAQATARKIRLLGIHRDAARNRLGHAAATPRVRAELPSGLLGCSWRVPTGPRRRGRTGIRARRGVHEQPHAPSQGHHPWHRRVSAERPGQPAAGHAQHELQPHRPLDRVLEHAVRPEYAPVRPALRATRAGPAPLARQLRLRQEPGRQLRGQLLRRPNRPARYQVRLRAAEPAALTSGGC